jgi:hypothetical protein
VSFKPYVRSFHSGANVISVQCALVHFDSLKGLLWSGRWSQVDVQIEGLENVGWAPEAKMLDLAAKALKGVARLTQEPVDQINLWKRGKVLLGKLMDLGWRIHAGATADVVAIVLSKRDVANIEATVEWESDPDLRGIQIVDDWLDGLHLLHRRRF